MPKQSKQSVPDRRSSSDRARDRAAVRDLVPGFVVLLVTQGSLIALNPQDKPSAWYIAWSLSPLLPSLWLIWGQFRALHRADEYQRIAQLESLAIGFAAVIMLCLVGSLLDAAGLGDASRSLQVTFTVGVITWVAALTVKTR